MKEGRVSSAITRATLSARMVQNQDLCAREANFHQFCRKLFNLQYINHLNDKEGVVDKKQDGMAFAIIRHSRLCLIFFRTK